MGICPICLYNEHDKTSLEKHIKLHGYDDFQIEVLIDYEPKYKGLIDNVTCPDLSISQTDERYIYFNRAYKAVYNFLLPFEFGNHQLKVIKTCIDLLLLYNDILSSKLYLLKVVLDGEINRNISFQKFFFLTKEEKKYFYPKSLIKLNNNPFNIALFLPTFMQVINIFFTIRST